jgi:hypothetical protein
MYGNSIVLICTRFDGAVMYENSIAVFSQQICQWERKEQSRYRRGMRAAIGSRSRTSYGSQEPAHVELSSKSWAWRSAMGVRAAREAWAKGTLPALQRAPARGALTTLRPQLRQLRPRWPYSGRSTHCATSGDLRPPTETDPADLLWERLCGLRSSVPKSGVKTGRSSFFTYGFGPAPACRNAATHDRRGDA